MAKVARALRNEDGSLVEIVYCRATKCNHNMGQGKCNVVHTVNSDDKISVGVDGRCENFFIEQRG